MSRIRANQITNQSADGAPTVQNGLVISGVTTSTSFSGSGANLTNIPSAQLTGALPAISGANLTNIPSAQLTGALPAISGANLTSLPTQVTIANNGNDRIITGGSGVNLNGEANLQFDGTNLFMSDELRHLGDPDTKIGFDTDTIDLTTAGSSRIRITSDSKIGFHASSPNTRFQVGNATFNGGHGMYQNDRVGMANHGNLTGLMLASTYNDAGVPEYGLVFVQGPTTSNYNCWSISPDGPAKGNSLSLHYGAQNTNIHILSNRKFEFDGDGDDSSCFPFSPTSLRPSTPPCEDASVHPAEAFIQHFSCLGCFFWFQAPSSSW